jgi:Kef-type K+ transport system membrane component KefB
MEFDFADLPGNPIEDCELGALPTAHWLKLQKELEDRISKLEERNHKLQEENTTLKMQLDELTLRSKAASPLGEHDGHQRPSNVEDELFGPNVQVHSNLSKATGSQSGAAKPRASLKHGADCPQTLLRDACEDSSKIGASLSLTCRTGSESGGRTSRIPRLVSESLNKFSSLWAGKPHVVSNVNMEVVRGSAMSMERPAQAAIYLCGIALVVFTLVAKGTGLGEVAASESSSASSSSSFSLDAPHRILGGGTGDHAPFRRLGAGPSLLMTNIAFCFTGVGLMALTMNFFKQPLILGYLLGGVLVGPIGLNIVHSHEDIQELSSLGLFFLLFMIGLELDVMELLKMGKVVMLTGLLQFPITAGVMICIFTGLHGAGVTWGSGQFSAMYVGLTCAISSTMIVVKLLSEKMEMAAQHGRLTIGILIFQDVWAIIVLAIQPNMENPQVLPLLKTFGMIAVLIAIASAYAKFVMPAVFAATSKCAESMLVMSLAWAFYVGCIAILPFVGLSLELAALIAGVVLASFPYSAEFNGKIRYIRDFFITLFFIGLGMQLPTPTLDAVAKALLVVIVVVLSRWLGIFAVVWIIGGGKRLAATATINLTQISEFALVICTLGKNFGHIEQDTLTILIWSFSILAIASSYLIGYNHAIYGKLSHICQSTCACFFRSGNGHNSADTGGDDDEHEEEHDIVLLGFHKVAAALIAEMEAKSPALLHKLHVIDFNTSIVDALATKGVMCSYGDISCKDVLQHAHHGEVRLVLSTIPDSMLVGVTNADILRISKELWPQAHCIVTSDSQQETADLYKAGADYVLQMALLCSERLQHLLVEYSKNAQASELNQIFANVTPSLTPSMSMVKITSLGQVSKSESMTKIQSLTNSQSFAALGFFRSREPGNADTNGETSVVPHAK